MVPSSQFSLIQIGRYLFTRRPPPIREDATAPATDKLSRVSELKYLQPISCYLLFSQILTGCRGGKNLR